MTESFIIATDLDGTLLDHHDYSWTAAKPALELCRQRAIPVVLNTSKTAAEVAELQRQLGMISPLVIENGSALIIPDNLLRQSIDYPSIASSIADHTELPFGTARAKLLQFIDNIRISEGWELVGFNDWSVAEIATNTGLSLEAAALAADKKYSEPFVWRDSNENFLLFEERAEGEGMRILKGGRFFHLQGLTDKAKPLRWLCRRPEVSSERADGKTPPKLICLGDSHNDVDMLNCADYPVCVRSPVADFPELHTNKPIIYTRLFGPAGWNEAVLSLIN